MTESPNTVKENRWHPTKIEKSEKYILSLKTLQKLLKAGDIIKCFKLNVISDFIVHWTIALLAIIIAILWNYKHSEIIITPAINSIDRTIRCNRMPCFFFQVFYVYFFGDIEKCPDRHRFLPILVTTCNQMCWIVNKFKKGHYLLYLQYTYVFNKMYFFPVSCYKIIKTIWTTSGASN